MTINQADKTIDLDALRESVFSADETMQAARILAATDTTDTELLFRLRATQDNHSIAKSRFKRAFNQVVATKRAENSRK